MSSTWPSLVVQSIAAAAAAALSAWRSATASRPATQANRDAVAEMRQESREDSERRTAEDLREMHSLLTELEQGEYSSSTLRSMYAMKRRLAHMYRVARVHMAAVAAVADSPNDPAAFRPLVPRALEEVRIMLELG